MQISQRFDAVYGLGIGVIIGILALLSAGSGHGTYVPLIVSSAPFSYFGVTASLVGSVAFWTAIGLGLEWLGGSLRRYIVGSVLLSHYCFAVWLVSLRKEELLYLRDGPLPLWTVSAIWLALYISLQIVVWRHCIHFVTSDSNDAYTHRDDSMSHD